MKKMPLILIALTGVLLSCGESGGQAVNDNAVAQHWATLKRQNAEYDRQQTKGAEGLRRAEELDKRYEVLLAKWEEQAVRMDAILDQWERFPGRANQGSSE